MQEQIQAEQVLHNEIDRRAFLRGGLIVGGALAMRNVIPRSVNSVLSTPPHQLSSKAPMPETEVLMSAISPEEMLMTPEYQTNKEFLLLIGNSMLAQGQESHGGLRFPSRIQGNNDQTDRDVGDASVGMGLLILDEAFPGDPKWVDAAEKVATWLTAVSVKDANGRHWPDYANNRTVSSDVFTSFDDGAIGIGDFYWRLYDRTGKDSYKEIALETLEWTFSQAENIGNGEERWKWDVTDPQSLYYMGMGEGVVGLIHTFAIYYQRLKNSDPVMAAKCKTYIDGGLRYLDDVRTALGNNIGDATYSRAIPETGVIGTNGDTTMNAGYLSGAAGGAFMYLKLHETFGDQKYLDKADEIFSWLEDSTNGPLVKYPDGTVAWKLAIDPQGGNDNRYATGFEEGIAGIVWVYLQAYKKTGKQKYLDMVKRGADRLVDFAIKPNVNELAWREDMHPNNADVHVNLNNGAAGDCMVLQDIYLSTGIVKYHEAAQKALNWIKSKAIRSGKTIYFKDIDNGKIYKDDTSMHWGDSGYADAAARMSGGTIDLAGGEEQGL
jgi:hypothetical protein